MIDRRRMLGLAVAGGAFSLLAACNRQPAAAKGVIRIGIVAKSLGNGFFNAVKKGADEAAAELGKVEIIFTGPPTTTAEGQIQVIESLIAQQVDAITLSANDADALVPTLKKAMQRGIKVISFDSAVAKEGRIVHLGWSSDPLIGQACVDLTKEILPNGAGKFAIVSATPTSTNQNAWIAEIKRLLPSQPQMQLVGVVYGDDLADKSYRETQALMKQHPDIAAILSPTSVGIVAAAKAVQDADLGDKIHVTGLGLPSELAGYVKTGVVKSFAIGNPIDLGYSTIRLAAEIVHGAKAGPNTTLPIGRMGSVTFDADGSGPMGKPFRFDATNIDQYAKVF